MSYIVESEFIHEGLNCKVLFLDLGHRCGYVEVTNTPLQGKEYSENLNVDIDPSSLTIGKRSPIQLLCWDGNKRSLDILCNVHGGITFSGKFNSEDWWIGFDCAHHGDRSDFDKLQEYFPNKAFYYSILGQYGSIRSKEYVEEECKSLATQLKEIISLMK